MTIWEKICGEVNEKIEFLIEKNRTTAVKNRLKLTLARENKQMERVYMQIGRMCFMERRMAEDPQMEDFYQQIEDLHDRIERIQKTLEAVERREDNVITVDFGGTQPEEKTADEQENSCEPACCPQETEKENEPCKQEDEIPTENP